MKAGLAALAAAMLLGGSVVAHAETLKIGFLATLSGPLAVIGQHSRDGFLLAVKQRGGRLGGLNAEVIVEDDALKPDLALAKTQQFLLRDKVNFVVGMLSSNVLQATFQPITESGTFLIGVNAGTSIFAGEKCNPFFFSTSWENNQVPEAMGKYAQDSGYRRIVTLVPNYQGGRDATTGFKHHFKGEVLDEIYVRLGELDFAAELTRIRALKPDAVLVFMPGGIGVSLVRQYAQSGLAGSIPFLSAWTLDETTLPAIREAAVGLYSSSHWAPDLDNEVNAAFVKAFEAEYGYVPSNFAAQAYDAGLLIDSAVAAAGANLSDKDALRKALRAASFGSTRGHFRYNTNQFPIQDFYLVQVIRRADGNYVTSAKRKIFEDYADRQAPKCPM
ncbi:MAG: ABC transporter substrate-binding protein [Rhodospirillales bacterium]|nr:ABC transporter substrate-binding protein [Rhodospirillales bacterium]